MAPLDKQQVTGYLRAMTKNLASPTATVKATSAELYGIVNSLSYLSQMSLPVLAAMWVRGAVRVFMPLVEDVDRQRQLLLDRYALRDEDDNKVVSAGGNVEIDPEKAEAFQAEIAALLDMEHDIVCKPLNAKRLIPTNPTNEVLIQPSMIASLEDAGLIVVTE